MFEQSISVDRMEQAVSLFGSFDENIRIIEKEFDVDVVSRGSEIKVTGEAENVSKGVRAINGLLMLINRGEALSDQNVRYVISLVNEGNEDQLPQMTADCICITSKGKPVKPKTLGQKKYIESIRKNTVTLGVGPAGTGKTYLAVAMAVTAFRAKEVNRIILTRPAVEAGEKLGFLPGDLQQKVDPYLRPLYDALFDMLGAESFQKQLERGNIEVAPLAYMRGRTLDDSFIILDEAQNTSVEQMKMFLTRLGFNSKMVVTGDITQIDLPDGRRSGLVDAVKVLKDVDDIQIVRFNERDVVRHKLVQDIINAHLGRTRRSRSCAMSYHIDKSGCIFVASQLHAGLSGYKIRLRDTREVYVSHRGGDFVVSPAVAGIIKLAERRDTADVRTHLRLVRSQFVADVVALGQHLHHNRVLPARQSVSPFLYPGYPP